MLKRRVAAIAWGVGTGVSAETRLNEQAGSGGLIEFELAIQVGADSFSLFLCHQHVNLFFVIPGPTEKIVRKVGPSEIHRRCKEKPLQKLLPIW